MNDDKFMCLRMDGKRFSGHAIPLEMAPQHKDTIIDAFNGYSSGVRISGTCSNRIQQSNQKTS